MGFNRPLVCPISWCAQCVSCLSRPPDVKIGGLMENQSSIPSTRREREREEMTDVEGNAKLCNGNQICRGSFERYMCLPEIFQVHQVIFIWVEDSKASARHTHTSTHAHPGVQGRTKWWVTHCLIALLPLPTAVSSKSHFWQPLMCLPDTLTCTRIDTHALVL